MITIPMLVQGIKLLQQISETQAENLKKASQLMADAISADGLVHVYGSGHSHMMAEEAFPRYGSFIGFNPLLDPRLMWFNVVGAGGARELLWLERQEGYVKNYLLSYELQARDVMLIFSHGGLNAAPVEIAMIAKEKGLKIVAVTSKDNYLSAKATHSSGKKLGDIADILIDNCVPLDDALIEIPGLGYKVGAGSTLAGIAIIQSLVTEVARILVARGHKLKAFVSPNVVGISKDHNLSLFEDFTAVLNGRSR